MSICYIGFDSFDLYFLSAPFFTFFLFKIWLWSNTWKYTLVKRTFPCDKLVYCPLSPFASYFPYPFSWLLLYLFTFFPLSFLHDQVKMNNKEKAFLWIQMNSPTNQSDEQDLLNGPNVPLDINKSISVNSTNAECIHPSSWWNHCNSLC